MAWSENCRFLCCTVVYKITYSASAVELFLSNCRGYPRSVSGSHSTLNQPVSPRLPDLAQPLLTSSTRHIPRSLNTMTVKEIPPHESIGNSTRKHPIMNAQEIPETRHRFYLSAHDFGFAGPKPGMRLFESGTGNGRAVKQASHLVCDPRKIKGIDPARHNP